MCSELRQQQLSFLVCERRGIQNTKLMLHGERGFVLRFQCVFRLIIRSVDKTVPTERPLIETVPI